MPDIAALGLAVDSSQVKTATTELDKFADAAKKIPQPLNAVEVAAKKAGISVEEMNRRIAAAGVGALGAASHSEKLAIGMSLAGNSGLVAGQRLVAGMGAAGKAAMDAAKAANAAAIAHGAFSTQAMSLQHALRGSVEQIALGVSPTQALTAQMNHLVYAASGPQGLGGALSEVKSMAGNAIGFLGGLLTPVRLIAGGLLGIGVAGATAAYDWDVAQKQIDRSLIGVGRRSGATRDDVNKFAQATADASNISVTSSREIVNELLKSGGVYKENLTGLASVTRNFSIVSGESLTDAAKTLGKAFSGDLVDGAEKLNQSLGFLDGKTREYIRTLENSNQVAAAQRVLLDAMAPSISRATETLTPFERAWNAVTKAASDAKNAIGKALSGPSDQEQLASLTSQRDAAASGTGRRGSIRSGLAAGGFFGDDAKVAGLNAQIDVLREKMEAAAKLAADDRFKQFSLEADNAVRALIPEIARLEELEKLQAKIKRAQSDPNVGGRQGLGGSNSEASNAAEVLSLNITNTRAETERANKVALELVKTYNTGSIEIAKMRAGLADQLLVASAVGGQARMAAQERATYNELIRQGKKEEDAAGVATAQRAATQAQINTQVKETTFQLQNQLGVSSAVGGAVRLAAQEQATFTQLVHDGASAQDAADQAAAQRSNSQAQINTQAKEALFSLTNQRDVAEAITGAEKIQAQAEATKNQLIHDGVDARIASKIAAEQEAQAVAQIDAQIQNQIQSLQQSTSLIKASQSGAEAETKAKQAYDNASRAGASYNLSLELAHATYANERAKQIAKAADEEARLAIEAAKVAEKFAAQMKYLPSIAAALGGNSKLFDTPDGGKSQFNPSGYKSSEQSLVAQQGTEAFGAGGYSAQLTDKYGGGIITPNAQGYEFAANRTLASNGSVSDAINSLLSNPGGAGIAAAPIDAALTQTLSRLTDLIPDDQKSGVIQRQIDQFKLQPETLARDEAIKALTDSLKQLTDASKANTEAIQAQLDPLMSQGHAYLDQLKIGYYHAASGLDMTANGPSAGDKVPFHAMINGGERIRITPAGAPNDNSRSVVQTNNFYISEASGSSVDRMTTRQRTQGYISAASRAVG